MTRRFYAPIAALILVFSVCVAGLADTVRLKDGSVIRGQVIGFKDQQFVILVGAGARGRRSQVTIYMEDVESIEFDSAGSTPINTDSSSTTSTRPSTPSTSRPPIQQPDDSQNTRPQPDTTTSQPTTRPSAPQSQPAFFQINTRVRADSTANGWTNSGLVVRRGQRIRINASGRVTLGAGRVSVPAGVPALADNEKLMRSYPTGALIAVIGDDNDDFIFIGQRREFIAQRDGVLFFGVNEGNLSDNTGAYDVVIEAEAMNTGR